MNLQHINGEARWGAVFPGNFVPVLTFEGKCSRLRAKPAHLVGHLPPQPAERARVNLESTLSWIPSWLRLRMSQLEEEVRNVCSPPQAEFSADPRRQDTHSAGESLHRHQQTAWRPRQASSRTRPGQEGSMWS